MRVDVGVVPSATTLLQSHIITTITITTRCRQPQSQPHPAQQQSSHNSLLLLPLLLLLRCRCRHRRPIRSVSTHRRQPLVAVPIRLVRLVLVWRSSISSSTGVTSIRIAIVSGRSQLTSRRRCCHLWRRWRRRRRRRGAVHRMSSSTTKGLCRSIVRIQCTKKTFSRARLVGFADVLR